MWRLYYTIVNSHGYVKMMAISSYNNNQETALPEITFPTFFKLQGVVLNLSEYECMCTVENPDLNKLRHCVELLLKLKCRGLRSFFIIR